MKISQTWKRNTPDTINGDSITIKTTYYSFNQDEIDELEKNLPEGILFLNTTIDGVDELQQNLPITKIKMGRNENEEIHSMR